MSSVVQYVNLNVRGYSSTQRAAFAGLLVGFLMCAIGCFPPYWKTGNISIDSLIKVNVIEFRAGLWLFCVKVVGIEEQCSSTSDVVDTLHEMRSLLPIEVKDTSKQWLVITCGASILCLLLSFACGLAACCRFCCCNGGKTMCHGIMAFIAGACGIVAVAGFSLKADDVYGLPILDLDNGWALFIFATGSAILVISSFLLCFSSPRENPYQMMPAPGPMPVVVAQTSTSTQMNAATFPPVQPPVMYREMETRPSSYGHQDEPQPKY